MSLSKKIVQFIDHLFPLYIHEKVNGVWCARSLSDGTLICPIDEAGDDESGFVTVLWQGDPARQSVVPGAFMASLAVAKYVEIRNVAENAKATRDEMAILSQHFTFKTGASLVFESPDSDMYELFRKAVLKVGETAVTEILKKQIGL